MAGEQRRKMHRASAWRRISPLYCEKPQVWRARRGKHREARLEKRGRRKHVNGTRVGVVWLSASVLKMLNDFATTCGGETMKRKRVFGSYPT